MQVKVEFITGERVDKQNRYLLRIEVDANNGKVMQLRQHSYG